MQSAADNEEELFDVVDEHNRVTGQERRSVVHARGLKHRAVYCFVFNNKGELLLQQRSPQCARAAEAVSCNCWCAPNFSANRHVIVVSFAMCRKKIGPLQWDLSVAEHLQPGEDYRTVRSHQHHLGCRGDARLA